MTEASASLEVPAGLPPGQRGTNLYRSPLRIGVLAFFAPFTYFFWWNWQLFKFTKREGFPRAKSFWWTLLPIVGWIVTWQQLDDLKHAAASKARVYPWVVVGLFIGAGAVGQLDRFVNADAVGLQLLLIAIPFFLIALGIYLAQRSITSYLAATYPDERRRRISVGEVVAVLLSFVLYAGAVGVYIYWTTGNGSAVSYLPPATPVAGAVVPEGWTQYRDTAAGFAVQLPPGWSSVAFDAQERLGHPTTVIRFYAEANDKSALFKIIRQAGPSESLDEAARDLLADLEKEGFLQLAHDRTSLPAGDTVHITADETYSDGQGGSLTGHDIEYLLVKSAGLRSVAYLLDFAVGDPITDEMRATIAKVAATFQML